MPAWHLCTVPPLVSRFCRVSPTPVSDCLQQQFTTFKEHGCGPGRMDKVPHPVVHEGLAGRLCYIENLAGIGCIGLMYMRSDQSSGLASYSQAFLEGFSSYPMFLGTSPFVVWASCGIAGRPCYVHGPGSARTAGSLLLCLRVHQGVSQQATAFVEVCPRGSGHCSPRPSRTLGATGGHLTWHMMPLLLALSEKKFPVEAVASIGRL